MEKKEEKQKEAVPAAEQKPADKKPEVKAEAKAAAPQPPAPAQPKGPTPLEKAQAEAKEMKDHYLRTLADFDNFRKRTARDREDLIKGAAGDVIKDLLVTVDHLALALSKAPKADDPFVVGIKLVYDGFLKTLADHGATPLDSLGEPFDPSFHEALVKMPSDKVPADHVLAETRRGWLLNGKLLRAAQVVVSSGKPAAPSGKK